MKISSYFDMLHRNARSFAIDFDFFFLNLVLRLTGKCFLAMILTLLPKKRVTIEGFFFDTPANIFAKILFVFVSDKSDQYFFNMSVNRSCLL